jgi:glycosyltransferase involved in cell wall biosynthesis
MANKILVITDNLPEQINGVVTTYKNLESYAFADGYTIDYIDPRRYRYIDCPKYNEVKLSAPFNIGKTIQASNPDYIHIATEGPIGLFARNYLTVAGLRYNTAYHTKFPEGLKTILGIPEFITWPLIRWFHSNSHKVLTTTPSMVTSLVTNGFKNNIISWTRGVDRSVFYPDLTKYEESSAPILYVGRVSKEKNIEAFLDLPFRMPKVVVGDGPHRKYLQFKYPDATFVGYKTGKELAHYYQTARVFVFPSKWDTFGIVQLEAMACGTPVAAFNVQGPRDVVDHNLTGCLHRSLEQAVLDALKLDRDDVAKNSMKWSWKNAWQIFKDSLISVK